MLLGGDDDVAAQVTAAVNRLRGWLVQIHPSLEKALGTMSPTMPYCTCSTGRWSAALRTSSRGAETRPRSAGPI